MWLSKIKTNSSFLLLFPSVCWYMKYISRQFSPVALTCSNKNENDQKTERHCVRRWSIRRVLWSCRSGGNHRHKRKQIKVFLRWKYFSFNYVGCRKSFSQLSIRKKFHFHRHCSGVLFLSRGGWEHWTCMHKSIYSDQHGQKTSKREGSIKNPRVQLFDAVTCARQMFHSRSACLLTRLCEVCEEKTQKKERRQQWFVP